AEMLLHGATTCVDFFSLHDSGNENAGAVIEAARRVGIRLVLARSMYDWEGAPRRYRETVADATRRTRELITAHRKDATTLVHPAPHSPHGASPAMIRAGWEVAEAEQVPFHIHVAEAPYEGERTTREQGATPIHYLDRLGVLGPRMIGVHGVWLDDDEIALIGARGGAHAHCPRANMRSGGGLAPSPCQPPAGRRGCHVAWGRERRRGGRATGRGVGAGDARGAARASAARRGVGQGMVDLDGGPRSLGAGEAVARRGEEARLAPG